jgi:hypothetical protein
VHLAARPHASGASFPAGLSCAAVAMRIAVGTHAPLLNKRAFAASKKHCYFCRRGDIVKIPVLVTMLVVAMLTGLAFIFLVM